MGLKRMRSNDQSHFLLAFRGGFLASSEARRSLSFLLLLLVVAGLLLGALAAAPGCMKILRIFFSSRFGLVFNKCPSSWSRGSVQLRRIERRYAGPD
jgi:hypothetical protein